MDNSISDQNKTCYFQSNSISFALDQSSMLAFNIPQSENIPRPQQQGKEFQKLSLDWDLLEKEPLLLQQTAKLLQKRADDPILSTLSVQFRQLRENHNNNVLADLQAQKQQELTQKQLNLQKLQQLSQRLNQMSENNLKRSEQSLLLKKQNRFIISHIKSLQSFIKEMATDIQNNPFAKIDDSTYINSLRIVSEINEQFGKVHKQMYLDFENPIQKLQVHNKIMIDERNLWIPMAMQLDRQLKHLIKRETQLLEHVRQQIQHAKQLRQDDKEESDDSEIIEAEDREINFQVHKIPDLFEKTITKLYTCEKDSQQIHKPLQQYHDEIYQLSRQKHSLQTELKHSQSIMTEKTNKNALLQKQHQQLQAEIKKLQNANQSQTSLGGDQVNYQGLIFKTYEQKENQKRHQRREDNIPLAELPKPAKRILVEKPTLPFTQRFFPFIKNYKQLVNWAIALWLLVILVVFAAKVSVRSGVQQSPQDIVEIEVPERPVVHTFQSKHKTEVIANTSNTIDLGVEKLTEAKENDDDTLLDLRRKQMEQLNNKPIHDEPQDWRQELQGFQ